jgi:hypothetical protein
MVEIVDVSENYGKKNPKPMKTALDLLHKLCPGE